MLDFIWKYKYVFYSIIFLIFLYALHLVSNPKIFFDTERILKYADDIQIELKESFNDKNLLLLGVEFEDEISFEEMRKIDSAYNLISNDTLIKIERSIFSEKRMIFSGLFFHSFNVLSTASEIKYNTSLDKLKEKSSLFLSKDFKKLFFILEMKDNLESNIQENLILNIKQKFENLNTKNVFVSGQIPSELYMQENVVKELFLLTILSAVFCFLILWFFTMNLKFVFLTLLSVIFSVVISISISQFIYGGIELVMIIMPAIIFIVCVSTHHCFSFIFQ